MDVAALEDRLKILELPGRWMHVVDRSDADGMAEMFTDDAVWETRGYNIRGLPPVMKGRQELEAGFISRFRRMPRIGPKEERQRKKGGDRRRHYMTNVVVEEQTETTARVSSYVLVTSATDQALTIALAGLYEDELVKGEEGNWQFARRVLTPDRDVH